MKELGNYIGSCGAGRFYMAIDGKGDIYPCEYFRDLKIANIRDDLDTMWLNNDILLKLRNRSLLKESADAVNPNIYVVDVVKEHLRKIMIIWLKIRTV